MQLRSFKHQISVDFTSESAELYKKISSTTSIDTGTPKQEVTPKIVRYKGGKESKRPIIVWGDSNDAPIKLQELIEKNAAISGNLSFMTSLLVGQGRILAVKKTYENGRATIEPYDNKDIQDFFTNNDIATYLANAADDLLTYGFFIPELIANPVPATGKNNRQILILRALQSCFVRLEQRNPTTGEIDNCYYSTAWHEESTPADDKIAQLPLLPKTNTVQTALQLFGINLKSDGKATDSKITNLGLRQTIAAGRRVYYPRPLWHTVFSSGWADFYNSLIDYKKSLMNNQLTVRYHVEFADDYFQNIFTPEKIDTPEAKKARIDKEFEDFKNTLSGTKQAGGTLISFFKTHPTGGEISPGVKITVLENPSIKGEYIEDIETAHNQINYTMGIHGSLISTIGKNKTISGTEARELFNMHQAMAEPMRELLLYPLHIIKAINKWPDDVDFIIPNQELTRIDENTGAARSTSQNPLM